MPAAPTAGDLPTLVATVPKLSEPPVVENVGCPVSGSMPEVFLTGEALQPVDGE